MRDARLRECDYGKLTRRPVCDIEAERAAHIATPFPDGESYATTRASPADGERRPPPERSRRCEAPVASSTCADRAPDLGRASHDEHLAAEWQ